MSNWCLLKEWFVWICLYEQNLVFPPTITNKHEDVLEQVHWVTMQRQCQPWSNVKLDKYPPAIQAVMELPEDQWPNQFAVFPPGGQTGKIRIPRCFAGSFIFLHSRPFDSGKRRSSIRPAQQPPGGHQRQQQSINLIWIVSMWRARYRTPFLN